MTSTILDVMGWFRDGAPEHEGWVSNVLDDGRATGTTSGVGVVAREVLCADRAADYEIRTFEATGHQEVVVPWNRVAAWRVECECGWQGGTLPAYDTDEDGSRDCPGTVEDEVFLPLWSEHVAPFTALGDLERLIELQRDLEERAAAAVAAARRHGASWSHVGRAAGLTRQGAQQRWGSST